MHCLYEDAGTLYAKGQGQNTVRAYSTAGTTNKTASVSKEINLDGSTHSSVRCMFSDADYFYFGRTGALDRSENPVIFDAYSKTTRLRDTNGDLSFRFGNTDNNINYMGAVVHNSIVYVSIATTGQVFALVKAV